MGTDEREMRLLILQGLGQGLYLAEGQDQDRNLILRLIPLDVVVSLRIDQEGVMDETNNLM